MIADTAAMPKETLSLQAAAGLDARLHRPMITTAFRSEFW
jgi:hypothetical protein